MSVCLKEQSSGCREIPTERYQFTGKERDGETGLDDFGARYYASNMGRFMSPDPLLASATLENPQSWNRYSYALNNPLRLTDPEGLYASPAYNCDKDHSSCLNDEQRRILENSKVQVGDKTLSGQALWDAIGGQKGGEAMQNAFVNVTDRLASVSFGDGSNALSQVSSISGFAPDRVFANVSSSLLTNIQGSSDFTTVNAGLHGDYSAISFKDTGVMLGNIQFSFNASHTGADIDIDIGNINAKGLGRIIGGMVHAEEVIQNSVFGTKTNQDTVRKLLVNNPKVQTITPSPDPKWNRK
jgi:RHS repeat-associated protein